MGIKGTMEGAVGGFFTHRKAFNLLRLNRRIMILSILPLIINTALFSAAIWLFVSHFSGIWGYLTSFLAMEGPAHWYGWILWAVLWVLRYILGVILVAAFSVVIFFSFSVVGNLICAPFNEVISSQTEKLLVERKDEDGGKGLWGLLKEATYSFGQELKKLSFFIAVECALLLLTLIPAIGPPLFAVLNTIFLIYFMSFEYMDYPMSRRQMTFGEKRKFLKSNKPESLGFGSAAFLAMMIPGLNILFIPLNVIAATILFMEIKSRPSKDR